MADEPAKFSTSDERLEQYREIMSDPNAASKKYLSQEELAQLDAAQESVVEARRHAEREAHTKWVD